MTNAERAELAKRALGLVRDEVDDQTALSDLLANLMHWANIYGVDFGAALEGAWMHYKEELVDED